MAGRIMRGEVRLYPFPPPDKQRPVVVLTRDNLIAHLSKVTVAPITSAVRGAPSEVPLNEDDGMKGPCAVNLHNTSTVPRGNLGKRVAHLSPEKMNQICAALRFSLECDS